MNIYLSDDIVAKVVKLIEDWRIIDKKINKVRHLVSELVMESIINDVKTQQSNTPVEWEKDSNPDTI